MKKLLVLIMMVGLISLAGICEERVLEEAHEESVHTEETLTDNYGRPLHGQEGHDHDTMHIPIDTS